MKKGSFLVTKSIPGIAAKGEVIKFSDDGILIGRWLVTSKYPKLMASRDSLRPPREVNILYQPVRRVVLGDRSDELRYLLERLQGV